MLKIYICYNFSDLNKIQKKEMVSKNEIGLDFYVKCVFKKQEHFTNVLVCLKGPKLKICF